MGKAGIVEKFFADNPEALTEGNYVDIAKRLGVGKTTVYRIAKELRTSTKP